MLIVDTYFLLKLRLFNHNSFLLIILCRIASLFLLAPNHSLFFNFLITFEISSERFIHIPF